MTIKQWLSLISVVLAFLSFVEALLTEKVKNKIIRAVDTSVKMLDNLKPRTLIIRVNKIWVWRVFEGISYIFFLSSVYLIPKFWGVDLWQLRKHPNEELGETSLYLVNFVLDLFANPLMGILALAIILIVVKNTVWQDAVEMDINYILGDGTLKYYFNEFLKFIGGIVIIAVFYLVGYFLIHSQKVNDFLNWLPDFISMILGTILLLIGVLTFGFSLPAGLIIFFSAYLFSLVLVLIINFLEYCILFVKAILRWIYGDPKRSWAIITTLISLVVALGEFGTENIEKKSEVKQRPTGGFVQ